jgi:hypothetical protein
VLSHHIRAHSGVRIIPTSNDSAGVICEGDKHMACKRLDEAAVVSQVHQSGYGVHVLQANKCIAAGT